MIIATIQDANALGCCCPYPDCASPRIETLNPCCIPVPFASWEDFSEMGLPENFEDLCFEKIVREYHQTETIKKESALSGGIPANFSSVTTDYRKAEFRVPLDPFDPLEAGCSLIRVARQYYLVGRSSCYATDSSGFYYVNEFDEHTSGTSGDCAGTYHVYTESVLPSGTDPGTTFTESSAFCSDLSFLIITPTWTYDRPGAGIHRFRRTTTTGDIEITGLATVTETITLTEWEGGELYKFCVPEDYSTEAAPRSTWEMQWDIAFVTERWLGWYLSDRSEPEPSNSPILHSSHDWTWGGSMEEPCSPVEQMPSPRWHGLIDDEESSIKWLAIRINVMIICWRSARTGQKPTAYGPQYAWPDPP